MSTEELARRLLATPEDLSALADDALREVQAILSTPRNQLSPRLIVLTVRLTDSGNSVDPVRQTHYTQLKEPEDDNHKIARLRAAGRGWWGTGEVPIAIAYYAEAWLARDAGSGLPPADRPDRREGIAVAAAALLLGDGGEPLVATASGYLELSRDRHQRLVPGKFSGFDLDRTGRSISLLRYFYAGYHAAMRGILLPR
jgi:hypothetical protein